MSYKISYIPDRSRKHRGAHRFRLPALTAVFFLLFLLFVELKWQEGAQMINRMQPAAVLDVLARELMEGEDVSACLSGLIGRILP